MWVGYISLHLEANKNRTKSSNKLYLPLFIVFLTCGVHYYNNVNWKKNQLKFNRLSS